MNEVVDFKTRGQTDQTAEDDARETTHALQATLLNRAAEHKRK